MKPDEVLMAGFGGQGMLLSGKLLAHAAMEEGGEVSWLPSYGPEMRGGTANVTVVVSDKPVASPYLVSPATLMVMNLPSLTKFGPKVRPGGNIIVNKSLIHVNADRDDCKVIYLSANEIAQKCGTGRAANLVMLGAYVAMTGTVAKNTMVKEIKSEFAKKPKFIDANVNSFLKGFELAKSQLKGKKK